MYSWPSNGQARMNDSPLKSRGGLRRIVHAARYSLAGLRALEEDELEQLPVIMNRHAPLFVVVGDVERIRSAPLAALLLSWHCVPSHAIAACEADP